MGACTMEVTVLVSREIKYQTYTNSICLSRGKRRRGKPVLRKYAYIFVCLVLCLFFRIPLAELPGWSNGRHLTCHELDVNKEGRGSKQTNKQKTTLKLDFEREQRGRETKQRTRELQEKKKANWSARAKLRLLIRACCAAIRFPDTQCTLRFGIKRR